MLHRLASRAPQWIFLLGTVLVGVLYSNPFAVLWGLALGLVWGLAFARVRRPLNLPQATFALLLGLVLSFALHANAQLLGRAMWLLK